MYAKKAKIDDGSANSTAPQNKFSALAGAPVTNLDQTSMPVTDMILFPEKFNLIFQELQRTFPTFTTKLIG
ncbi:hypothetical protein TNCT_212831 [Trichonephila clavata]|uniref:Uncharacterized protein n=1 Tax=Trichonephila clavata TaxID=2740835 RepID=A0A8X6GQS3_TRICU|nr:hypothetical protein TNCT_212831 [Trichonephila clavata]